VTTEKKWQQKFKMKLSASL